MTTSYQAGFQLVDVWRYRVYGLTESVNNNVYDVVFPGKTLPFDAGGMDVDWYQPLRDNALPYISANVHWNRLTPDSPSD